jgi:hypothetical protein
MGVALRVVATATPAYYVDPLGDFADAENQELFYGGKIPDSAPVSLVASADIKTIAVFSGKDWRGETPASGGGELANSQKRLSWGWNAQSDKGSYFQLGRYGANGVFDLRPYNAAAPFHPPSYSDPNNRPNYFLARSAYAVWVRNGDLVLAYDYRPWNGDRYGVLADGATPTKTQTLLKGVTNFLFQESGDVFRLRLCVTASDWAAMGNNDDNATQFCRERSL